MGPVDVTRVISRIEEIRGNTRAKIFEAANRLPVSIPILKEIEGQGLTGALSDRLPGGGILQGKGPILSRFLGPTPTEPKKEEKSDMKSEEQTQQDKKRNREELYSDSGIQI